MNIYSEHNISIIDDPRSDKKIVYLPLSGYAQLMAATEVSELASHLHGCSESNASTAVDAVMVRLHRRNKNVYFTQHTVDGLRSLMLLPNNKCNFKCSYCYSANGRTNEEISPRLLEAGLNYFLNSNRAKGERLSISVLGGGEPLLSWNVLKPSLEKAMALIEKRSAPCPISLVTNGSVCHDGIIQFCLAHHISLSVSFDILEDVQNAQRGCWQEVSANINRFAEAGIDVALNTVVSNDNVRRMTEMIAHLVSHHPLVRKVSFKTLITKDYFHTIDDRKAYYQAFITEFFKAKAAADECGIWLTCSYMNTCLCLSDRYCPGKFVITSEGDISTCHTVGSKRDELYSDFVFGRIDEMTGEVHVDETKLRQILSYDVTKSGKCQDCPARWHCAGGCYADYSHLNEAEHEAYCESMRSFLASYLIYKYKL